CAARPARRSRSPTCWAGQRRWRWPECRPSTAASSSAGTSRTKPWTSRALPTGLIRPTVWATGWLTGSLGVSVKALGLERYPFGACIVTSVGMFGVDEGYVPPTPFARVPVYVLAGAVRESPAVVGGRL